QDVDGHGALKVREREAGDPVAQSAGREAGDFSDRLAPDLDGERFRLESGTAAGGAGLGELVLPQEHPDVLLVALRLEPLEEREHAEEPPPRPAEQKAAGGGAPRPPRGVPGGGPSPRRPAPAAAPALVARLGP